MHFASQDQTRCLTWELWEEEEDAGGWVGFFFFKYILLCFHAEAG